MKRAGSLVLGLLLFAGCKLEAIRYKSYPPNPFPDITTVAVLPFFNETGEPSLDTIEFANLFASELVKFHGFRVVRPKMILATLGPQAPLTRSVEDAIRIGRHHRADAVLVASVTDWDPYNPPKIAASLQFLRVSARSLSSGEIDRIVQSASWRRGPLTLSRADAGRFIAAFEKVYDSHEERIREELIAYAQAQDEDDSPFIDGGHFLAVQSRYQQFVANQLINDILWATAPTE